MKPEQAKRWITDSRLDPYLAEVGGEHERAIALYVWNDRLWVLHLHKAFPHGSGDRAQIAGLMARLGPFRNRVAHHETIIRTPLADRHEDMLMLVETIDPEAREWVESVSSITPLLEGRP